MSKKKRFKKVYSQDLGTYIIFVDTETGVNYLAHTSGYGGGITPLLDRDGKPIITSVVNE